MRVVSVVFALLFLGGVATTAQAPAKPAPAKPAPAKPAPAKSAPDATLAQLMRGIMFPNSNILFDVQTHDPAAPKKETEAGGGATATFANIYTGWQTVENSALAIAEAVNLVLMPGRKCENGRPVPLDRADFVKYAQELGVAARNMYKAAQTKNQETASDATNEVAGACENCHSVYREKAPRCIAQ